MEVELDRFTTQHHVEKTEKTSRFGRGRAVLRKVHKNRLVSKHGKIQTQLINVAERRQLYLADHFTTLIESRWRYVFLIFSLSFLTSWLVFGSIWWGIYVYRLKYFDKICIEKVDDWTSAFLFSLETQTTIGYGGRQITSECPEGVILLLIQCIVGLLINSTMLGLIFAKLQRPYLRRSTILFSKNAVIAPRDNKMCLMFRVGDVRRTQLLETHIRVRLIQKHFSVEGEEITFFQQNLPVTHDLSDADDFVYLFVPVTVCHIIDEDSPFFNYSPDDLLRLDFEVVVILEGIVEPTGMTMQARTSYLPDEINWGHVFCPIVSQQGNKNGQFRVDFSRFHNTRPTDVPRCTPREFENFGHGNAEGTSNSGLSSTNSEPKEAEEEKEERAKVNEALVTDISVSENSKDNAINLVPNGNAHSDPVPITKL